MIQLKIFRVNELERRTFTGVNRMKKILSIVLFGLLIGLSFGAYAFYFDDKMKADKEHTILALGDSLTYGVGNLKEEGYVGKLESLLNTKSQNGTYSILNHGIPGQQSEGVLKQLAQPQISEKVNEVDYVILFIGTNDLRYSAGGDFQTISETTINKERSRYLDTINQIMTIIRQLDEEVPMIVVGLYNPFPEDRQLDLIIEGWNDRLKKTVSHYPSITFVPTDDLFQNQSKKDYFSDSLHLNQNGYQLIANRISKELMRGYGMTP